LIYYISVLRIPRYDKLSPIVYNVKGTPESTVLGSDENRRRLDGFGRMLVANAHAEKPKNITENINNVVDPDRDFEIESIFDLT